MALLDSQVLEELIGHGIRPSGYRIEFALAADATQFVNPQDPNTKWQERLAVVQTISLGYGADGSTAQFYVWDPKAIDTESIDNPEAWLVQPKNGDAIRIWINDGTGEKLAFKGTVRSVHDRKTSTGVIWTCEAVSEVSRLNETNFTGSFNFRNDPVRPQPVFNSDGTVHAITYTVKQIIEMILSFPDPWNSPAYFKVTSIDWNGLDTLDRCGKFKPANLSYDNQGKGRCIEDVLARAGNFTYLYDPVADKLKIVELNRQCNACGTKWAINFASTDNATAEATAAYASKYHVEEDSTEWTTRQTCNTVRIVAGKIRFYSGQFIIPETVTGAVVGSSYNLGYHTIDDVHDTAELQKKRARNPDGAKYRFVMPGNFGVTDPRKIKQHFVGLPLFPDWNIFEDWFPAICEIDEVLPPDPALPGFDPNKYKGKVEYQPHCLGDHLAGGNKILGYHDHLHTYQAWAIKGVCPACKGWGLVKKVFDNTDNEPNLELVAKGPKGQERYMLEVKNYLFKPSDFGNPTADISMLEPFYDEDGTPVDTSLAGGYPLPWKNTCPACRGVGYQPAYKIRNIEQELYRGRTPKTLLPADATTIPADPDQTQAGPEKWEDANNRLSLELGPLVQVEEAIMGKHWLPYFQHKDKPYTTPKNTDRSDISGAPEGLETVHDGSNGQPDERKYQFPHPLKYVNNHKALIGTPGVTVFSPDAAANGRRDKIVPWEWTCMVPFTTIQPQSSIPYDIDYSTGRIIFRQPMFIACRKPYAEIQRTIKNVIRVDSTGLLRTMAPGRGYFTADETGMPTGYWRPARVWMQFTYVRDRFYHQGLKNPFSGESIPTTTLSFTSPDGVEGKYQARAMIIDGCYCLEARKVTPENNTNNIEMSADNRPIQRCYTENESRIEVTESDFWKLTVPPTGEMALKKWDKARIDAKYDFIMGKAQTWQGTTPGEQMIDSMGWSAADYFGSTMRLKPHSWHLRDDRPRLLGLAVRRLDTDNDIQVSGSLSLVGLFHDTAGGLGWVDYPDKGKVVVKKITYNFSNGSMAEIELSREETRIGELPPDDKDRMHNIEQQVTDLRRSMELQRSLEARNNTGRTERQTGGQATNSYTGGG